MTMQKKDSLLLEKGIDFYSFNIAGFYLSALINGDCTAFSDEDQKCFDHWYESLPKEIKHFDVDPEEDSTGFSLCEVTGLMADCYTVRGII